MVKIKSNQYLFKKKINIRRKSKKELVKESFFMMIFGLFLLLLNYCVPQKIELFNSFRKNIFDIYDNLFEIILKSFEIIVVILICFTLIISIVLIIGSISRIIKIFQGKPSKIKSNRFILVALNHHCLNLNHHHHFQSQSLIGQLHQRQLRKLVLCKQKWEFELLYRCIRPYYFKFVIS